MIRHQRKPDAAKLTPSIAQVTRAAIPRPKPKLSAAAFATKGTMPNATAGTSTEA